MRGLDISRVQGDIDIHIVLYHRRGEGKFSLLYEDIAMIPSHTKMRDSGQ